MSSTKKTQKLPSKLFLRCLDPKTFFQLSVNFFDKSMRSSNITSDSVKLPKYKTLQFLSHVSSAIETQEPTSTDF